MNYSATHYTFNNKVLRFLIKDATCLFNLTSQYDNMTANFCLLEYSI